MRSVPLFLLFFCVAATAAELDGVRLDDQTIAGQHVLHLNGMALRTRFFFKVYVAGLYLPQKTQDAQVAMRMRGPKRMVLVMRRDVDADAFSKSLRAALRDSNPPEELERLQPQIDTLFGAIDRIGEAKKGAIILIDFVPASGTSLAVNGRLEMRPVAGDDFFAALLRVWMGEGPVAAQMKKALLGTP